MNITALVWKYAPKVDVKWTPQSVGNASGGFDEKTAGDSVDLTMNLMTPKPDELAKNAQGEPLIIDYRLYIPGVYNFGIDDHFEFYNTYAFGAGAYLVRETHYKIFGNYSMVGLQQMNERSDV